MKNCTKILFIFFTTLASCNKFNANDNVEYTISANELNIRSLPDKNSLIVGKLHKGDKIKISETNNNWAKVNLNNNIIGFINSDYIEGPESIWSKFKKGYFNGFKKMYVIVLVCVFGFLQYQTRVSDGRFTKGYRETEIGQTGLFISFIISALIVGILSIFWGLSNM